MSRTNQDKQDQAFYAKSFGGSNPEYINDTNTHTFNDNSVYCIQVISACAFDAGTVFKVKNGAGIVTDGLAAGTYFISPSAIKLTSGSLLVYKYA